MRLKGLSQRTPHADDRCRQNVSPLWTTLSLIERQKYLLPTLRRRVRSTLSRAIASLQAILSTHTECRLGYGYHRFGERLYDARMNFESPGAPAPLRPRQSHQLRPSNNSRVRQHQLPERPPLSRRHTVILNIAGHNSYAHIPRPSAHLLS